MAGLPFLFRDAKARAWYVYQSIVGLTWPCTYDQLRRDGLRRGFEDGWADGSLSFLSDVPLKDVDLYRELISSDASGDGL
ncbi:hypothetical protein [Maritimibacter sp. 55A14]|uniref:hypothetical protein n=1 Tax=Maritimibacter sp. 55A14 TaxID=2174844 RepID=UPI0011B2356E|nr:hypothetical protein [Maritimibacter sp. 55A14]